MSHPSEESLLFYRFGTIEPDAAQDIAEHLRTCVECAHRYARLGEAIARLDAYDAEASADEAVLSSALARATAVLVVPPVQPPVIAAERRPSLSTGAGLTPRTAAAEPPWPGWRAWLGLGAGASHRLLRLATTLGVCAWVATVGGGSLALHLGEPFQTRVQGEEDLLSGGHSLLRVSVLSLRREPIEGASVSVGLRTPAGSLVLFEGRTDGQGDVDASLSLPIIEAAEAELEVVVKARGQTDVVRHPVKLQARYQVHLGTDKPLYQPGQTMHLRALAMRVPRTTPAEGKEVLFEVRDPQGTRIVSQKARISRYGISSHNLELADDVALGTWRLSATVEGVEAVTKVQVARYTLPKFKLLVTPEHETVLAGARINARLAASYFFGKPVGGAAVRALVLRKSGAVLAEVKARTDADGSAQLTAELPPSLAEDEAEPVTWAVEVRDAAGQEESVHRAFTVARKPLTVEVFPEGYLVPGVEHTIFVVTQTPDGQPVSCEVELTEGQRTFAVHTARTGLGHFTFTAAASGPLRFSARAVDAQGRRVTEEVPLWVEPQERLLVKSHKALYRPGEPVEVLVQSAEESPAVTVEARAEGRLIQRTRVVLSGDGPRRGTGTLLLPADFLGELTLLAFAQSHHAEERARHDDAARREIPAWRLRSQRILVAEPEALVVKVSTDRRAWRPGEEAKVRFEVTDGQGKPKVAALGISVVDESLFAAAGGRTAEARASFLVRQALLKPRFGMSAAALVASPAWTDDEQWAGRLLLAGPSEKEQGKELLSAKPPGEAKPSSPPPLTRPAFFDSSRAKNVNRFGQLKGLLQVIGIGLATAVGLLLLAMLLVARPGKATGVAVVALVVMLPSSMVLAGVAAGVALGVAVLAALAGLAFVLLRGHWLRFAPYAVFVLLTCFTPWRLLFGARTLESHPTSMSPEQVALANRERDEAQSEAALAQRIALESAADFERRFAPSPTRLDRASDFVPASGNLTPLGVAPPRLGVPPPRREVHLRQHFPETLYVHPELVADERGVAELTVPLADSITSWRLQALASSADGKLGSTDAPLKVFQSFFVELDTPVALVRGDAATVPIAIHNYLDAPQEVRLEVQEEPWFELVGSAELKVSLAAGAVEGRAIRIRVKEPGQHTLTVRADGSAESDAVARRLLVTEAGKGAQATVSGRLVPGVTSKVALDIPKAAVGAVDLTVKLLGSRGATALDGIEGTLAQPHGCFEQTSATAYPNVLVTHYLDRSGRWTPELRRSTARYLSLGYQRLVGFEVSGGGFEWFGRAPASQLLTAYGLMEFTDMARVFPVDPALLTRTQQFLRSRQTADGSWNVDARMLRDGLFRTELSGRLAVTAYIAWALAETGVKSPELRAAQSYLVRHLGGVDDAYTLALVAAGLVTTGHPASAGAVKALVGKAQWSGDRVSFKPAGPTVYYGRGGAAEVETTALAAYALIEAKAAPELVKGALDFLLAQRLGHGAWASTQATVLSLKALLAMEELHRASPSVKVVVNGASLGALELSDGSSKVLALGDRAKKGLNVVELTSDFEAPFVASASYTLPWRSKGDDRDAPLALAVAYGVREVEVGGVVPAEVTLSYRGAEVSGMAMVGLGVPAGLRLLKEDLEALKAAGKLGKYQLEAGKAWLYLDRLSPGSTSRFSVRFKAVSSVDTRGVGSEAYLYYEPAVRASAGPVPIVVR